MDTRHLVAYALIAAILVAPFIIRYFIRRTDRRDRQEAERPIRITKDKQNRN